MSNTSKGSAVKGSKYWIQTIVNSQLQKQLNNYIGYDIEWISPLKGEKDVYSEYKLKQKIICNILGVSDNEKKDIFSFWPNNQPQWDGIALGKDKNTLFLVEAKANLPELKSKMTAKNEDSRNLIIKSMREVFNQHYPSGDFSLWTDKYYQLANRITFLHKMNERLATKNIEVKLILLNFVEDYTHIPTNAADWEKHYKEIFKDLTGTEDTPKNVIIINFFVPRV